MNENDGTAAVSAYTGLPAATLRYWRHTGEGPVSFKLGRRVLYRKVDVDAWLDEQYAKSARGHTVASA